MTRFIENLDIVVDEYSLNDKIKIILNKNYFCVKLIEVFNKKIENSNY